MLAKELIIIGVIVLSLAGLIIYILSMSPTRSVPLVTLSTDDPKSLPSQEVSIGTKVSVRAKDFFCDWSEKSETTPSKLVCDTPNKLKPGQIPSSVSSTGLELSCKGSWAGTMSEPPDSDTYNVTCQSSI